jgi:hypothetical protein
VSARWALCTVILAGCSIADAQVAAAGHSPAGTVRRAAVRHRHLVLRRSGRRSNRARAAIVGGSEIGIEGAPWQVEVHANLEGDDELRCGGSIVDLSHILTAGHCVIDPETGKPFSPSVFVVIAGTSQITPESVKNGTKVVGVRVHPYYHDEPGIRTVDDVAVLTLNSPLKASGAVQPIGVAAGSNTMEGAVVRLTGFGQQSPGDDESDGTLDALGLTLGFSRACGGEANALFLCGSAPAGTACHGDSGSGLTSTGSNPTLLGVLSIVQLVSGKECNPGALDGFINLTAPEVRDFVLEGNEFPPSAPRGGHAVIHGVPQVGYALSCEDGTWSGSPTFSYVFADDTTGVVLQSGGSSTYPLSPSDVGREIRCEVFATNAGGIGVGRTEGLGARIKQESPPESSSNGSGIPRAGQTSPTPLLVGRGELASLSLASATVPVHGVGLAAIRLICRGSVRCRGRLTLTVRRLVAAKGHKALRTLSIGTASVTMAAGQAVTVKIRLAGFARALLSAAHGRLSARLAILGLETEPLHGLLEPVRLLSRGASSHR